jgi:hypothetical protein
MYLQVDGALTNCLLTPSRSIGISTASPTQDMRIGDMSTNIKLTAEGYISYSSEGTFDHNARIGDMSTNIPLTSDGRMMFNPNTSTDFTAVTVGDIKHNHFLRGGMMQLTKETEKNFRFYQPTNSMGFDFSGSKYRESFNSIPKYGINLNENTITTGYASSRAAIANGIDRYVSLPSGFIDFDSISTAGSIIMSIWSSHATTGGSQRMMQSDLGASSKNGYYYSIQNNNQIRFRINGINVGSGDTLLTVGEWDHSLVQHDMSNGDTNIWINGSLALTGNNGTGTYFDNQDTGILANPVGNNLCSGHFDDARIFSASSFTNTMAQMVYNLGYKASTGEPEPDILYSTLLSDASVTSPEVGSAGTVTGSITYDANGADIDADGKYFDFPWIPSPTKGTLEIKWKPHFDNTSTTQAYITAGGGAATRLIIYYTPSTEICVVRGAVNFNTTGLTFSAESDNVVRILWDSSGIDGSSNIQRIYFNGVLNGTSDTAMPSLGQTILKIGNHNSVPVFANAVLKDIKIWSTVLVPS